MAVFSAQTVLPASGTTDLRSLTAAAGDAAIAAGYWAAGDGGGGEFYFEPTNDATKVNAVTQAQAMIESTSYLASPITVMARGHAFVSGQAVLLSGTAGADGAWIVTVVDADTFTLDGSAGDSVTVTEGGNADSVTVSSVLPHGRAPGQRLAVAGARWSPSTAPGINGQWDNIGVTGPTTVTIGASLSGSYEAGGVCGDDGFSVPVSSGKGRWVRVQQAPNDPRYFGARGDSSDGVDGSDDGPAFAAALFAMPAAGGTLAIPPPSKNWYRLGSDLAPDRPVKIIGPGKGVPCLSFAAGKGIRLRDPRQTTTGNGCGSSLLSDLLIQGTYVSIPEWTTTNHCVGARVRSTLANPANGGYDSGVHYRCVQIVPGGARPEPSWNNTPLGVTPDNGGRWIAEDWSTIVVTAGLVTIERCRIQRSTDNGIYLRGMSGENPPSNVNHSVVRDCFLYQGDAHGIFLRGDDANACLTQSNIIQAFGRGAGIYEAGFLGNVHLANGVEAGRLSYLGPNASWTVWIGNEHERDTGGFRLATRHLWLSGDAEPDAEHLAGQENPPRIYDGESWNVVKVAGAGAGPRVTQVLGSAAPALAAFSRTSLDRWGTIERFIDDDPDDPGGYYSRRNATEPVIVDPYDGGEDWTSERSLYLPFRRRFRQGFYLGSASQGLRPIWITSNVHPPGPGGSDLAICGRLLWDAGYIVLNRAPELPTLGWVAMRRGGWGGGRHGYRNWAPGAATIQIGEGIEPSEARTTGKVYRLLRFEVLVAGSWMREDRLEATLSGTEPEWPTVDAATIPEVLEGDGTHRIIWECWGDVGMTWGVLPAPASMETVP